MKDLAAYIDHTILKPTTTEAEVRVLCTEAEQHQFAAVCVPPGYCSLAAEWLASTKVQVATVIGFPFGYNCLTAKVAEIKQAISDGADELDVVINQSALHNGHYNVLSQEIVACLQPIRLHRKIIKVILETGNLTEDQIIRCCTLYSQHKVDFVKTSTGYSEKGASIEAVQLLRKHLPSTISIKASGGIRTFESAQAMIAAGASRIGTSSGVKIVST